MMKNKIWILLLSYVHIHAIVTPTGPRLWDNVALSETLAETIESQVDLLNSSSNNVDLAGTFTEVNALIDKSIVIQSDVNILYQSYIDVQSITQVSESKSCVIASIADVIQNQVEAVDGDINGTFTLIDGIEQNLLAKYAQAQFELEDIELAVDVLTGQVLAHFVATFTTIAELSEELESTVTSLQALSQLSESQTDILISLLDEIKIEARTIDSKVDVLQIEVESDFDGIFTVLDTIETNLCDNLSVLEDLALSVTVDLSGTFTVIAAVEQKVCDIQSVVEVIGQDTKQQVFFAQTIDSSIDVAYSKLCAVESKSFVVEDEVTIIASLIDHVVIDGITSKLDELEMNALTIESKACVLRTSVDGVALQNDRVDSLVDIFATTVSNIDSAVDNIISFADNIVPTICTVVSKVEVASSGIESINVAVESLIDNVVIQQGALQSVQENICQSMTRIDPINSSLDAVHSKITACVDDTFTIESRTDIIEQAVEIIQSRCDVIETTLINIESSVDVIDSLIDETFDKSCTVESKLTPLISTVDEIYMLSLCERLEDVQLDIRGTWTELGVIDAKIASTDTQVDMFESRLALLIDLVDADFSGTYTVLHTLLQKECTIDSKVDVLSSLVDDAAQCGQMELQGTFTLLDDILQKLCTADSQMDITLERIESLENCLGTPIRQVDVGTAGFNITTEGEYYLAEDINFAPVATNNAVIDIAVNNVTLNLNGYTITQTNGTGTIFGVRAAIGTENVEIKNGTIQNTSAAGVFFDNNCVCLRVRNLQISGTNRGIQCDPGCSDITISDVFIPGLTGYGIFLDDNGSDIRLTDCIFVNTTQAAYRLDALDNLVVLNCVSLNSTFNGFNITANAGSNHFMIGCASINSSTNGIRLSTVTNGVIKNCFVKNNGANGILVSASNNVEVVGCSSIGNSTDGITLADSSQCFVHDNVCIQNGSNNIQETGAAANSYLNNFALKTAGVNYNIAGGTTGFSAVTLQEGTASTPSPFPQKWTNINMIP